MCWCIVDQHTQVSPHLVIVMWISLHLRSGNIMLVVNIVTNGGHLGRNEMVHLVNRHTSVCQITLCVKSHTMCKITHCVWNNTLCTKLHKGPFRVQYGTNSPHLKMFTLTPTVASATNGIMSNSNTLWVTERDRRKGPAPNWLGCKWIQSGRSCPAKHGDAYCEYYWSCKQSWSWSNAN